MTTETVAKAKPAETFPAAEVEAKLRDLLLEAVISTAALKGVALPADRSAQCSAAVHLDFLGVVDVLCGVEPAVGFELQDSLVQVGGYRSINDAVERLMPRIEKAWLKTKIKKGKK